MIIYYTLDVMSSSLNGAKCETETLQVAPGLEENLSDTFPPVTVESGFVCALRHGFLCSPVEAALCGPKQPLEQQQPGEDAEGHDQPDQPGQASSCSEHRKQTGPAYWSPDNHTVRGAARLRR